MLTKPLLCKVWMIISMSVVPSALWFRCGKKILLLYWYLIKPTWVLINKSGRANTARYPADSGVLHEYSRVSDDFSFKGIYCGGGDGRVCRFFGCREKFSGECTLREIRVTHVRNKSIHGKGAPYFDPSGDGVDGWRRCLD